MANGVAQAPRGKACRLWGGRDSVNRRLDDPRCCSAATTPRI